MKSPRSPRIGAAAHKTMKRLRGDPSFNAKANAARRHAPLYVLPRGIEVVSERYIGKRIYIRVRPHPLIIGKIINSAVELARSRAVAIAILGRALARNEHVHHGPGGEADDRPQNLAVTSSADHNRLHHLGIRHTKAKRRQISRSVKRAYAEGRHLRRTPNQDERGRFT
jgi:hypothetical protein